MLREEEEEEEEEGLFKADAVNEEDQEEEEEEELFIRIHWILRDPGRQLGRAGCAAHARLSTCGSDCTCAFSRL